MKKKLFIIPVLLLIAFSSQAQFEIGYKGGLNVSKIYTNAGGFKSNYQQSLKTKTGFVLGIWARIGNKLFIQPEVVYNTKGGQVYVTPLAGGSPVSVKMQTSNLDVPVLIGYKLLGKIRLMAGPVASIKLSEDQKYVQQLRDITGDVGQAFQKATFGYQAGVGIHLLGFDIDVRKDGSLTDISSVRFPADEGKFNQRLTGWQVTLGRKIM